MSVHSQPQTLSHGQQLHVKSRYLCHFLAPCLPLLQMDQCDPNCCCDPECSEELVLFTSCTVETVSGEPRLCSQDVTTYSISETVDGYAQVRTSVQKQVNQDVLCIHSTNYQASLSLVTPEVPTVWNFDGLNQRFLQFWFGSSSDGGATLPTGETLNSSRYLVRLNLTHALCS
ncbi:hypothetical protein DPEC_G00370550 [Dallia pectoralis]|nr:hypothetical protein DPEC_G00370550 [Dallia pectoralis]